MTRSSPPQPASRRLSELGGLGRGLVAVVAVFLLTIPTLVENVFGTKVRAIHEEMGSEARFPDSLLASSLYSSPLGLAAAAAVAALLVGCYWLLPRRNLRIGYFIALSLLLLFWSAFIVVGVIGSGLSIRGDGYPM